MRGERGTKIAIAALLLVAVISGVYVGGYYYSLFKDSGKFDHLAALFRGGKIEEQDPGPEPVREDAPVIMPGFAELQAENGDLAGWLTIPGTVIDYPVMYTPDDPEFYLQRDFDKQQSISGTPFIDGRCSVLPRSDNLIIHAHNMRDGSMFAGLLRYETREFWQDHPRLEYYAGGEKQDYAIMAAFRTQAYPDRLEFCYDFITAQGQDEFNDFVAQVKEAALYETGVAAQYGDLFLTLSTCAYHTTDGRFVVVARSVSDMHTH